MLHLTPDRLLKKPAGSVLASLGKLRSGKESIPASDTACPPSRRRAQTWRSLFVAPCASLRPRRTAFLSSLFLLILLSFSLGVVACDQTQSVSITAEDFRFTPQLVTVSSAAPLILTVYNSGREVHEFDSPVLMYAANTSSAGSMKENGIVLEPGKSVQLAMALPPGTYLYICRRKGHASMAGTLIVK